MSSPTFITSFASSWMKILLSRSRSRVGQLTKEITKEKTAFANINSNSFDLYRAKIPDADKVDLMARVKAQALNSPPLRKSLFNFFPTGPRADTVQSIVKPTTGLTLGKRKLSTDPNAAGSVQKRNSRLSLVRISESTARRESTVRALYDRLNRYRFVLVRGTPASGKSTLAQLLADHIRTKEPETDPIMIDGWVRSKGRWSSRLPEYNNKGPNTLVIDEAQSTYWDSGLWNSLLKPIGALESPHRAILFASYGSPIGRVTTAGTPMYIPDRNRVSLQLVDHGDQITPVGLFYTLTEFADVVKRRYPSGHFEQDFLDYVFHATAGHPGAVTDLLRIVTAHDSYRNVKDQDKKYSLEIFHTEFPIENLWSCLDNGSIFRRGLPMLRELLDPSIARIFCAVLTNNFVTEKMLDSTEDKNALNQCFKYGWLHATVLQDETVYIFTTPLHRWFVEYYLGARVAKFTPIADQDLPTFAIEVIRNFSRLNLPFGEQIGALDRQRLPEGGNGI